MATDEDYIISRPKLEDAINVHGLGEAYFYKMKEMPEHLFQINAETKAKETYGEVLSKCVRTALELKKRNIQSTDIICICSYNHFNNIVPLIAGLMLGVKVASLDPSFSLNESTMLLRQIKPQYVFCSEDCVETIELALQEINLSSCIVLFNSNENTNHVKFEKEFLKPSNEEQSFKPKEIINNRETAMIFFSSGTTGLPKGICLSHYGLIQVPQIFDFGILKNGLFLNYSTTYWISCINILTYQIFNGACRLVVRNVNADKFWCYLQEFNFTTVAIPPTYLLAIANAKPKDVVLPNTYVVLTGGGPASTEQMLFFKKTFLNGQVYLGYGSTETSGIITFPYYKKPNGRRILDKHPGSCGLPCPGFSYKIVDVNTRKPVPHGEAGELLIKTDVQMNGYFNLDSKDAYEDGWLKTGDVVMYHPDGCFYHLDRTKEMFKYRTWHVQPIIVEDVVKRHPAVADVVVVGIPHPEDGDHPLALVVLKKGFDVNINEILQFANNQLDDPKKLRAGIKIVQSIPLTPSGKVKRFEIRRRAIKGDLNF